MPDNRSRVRRLQQHTASPDAQGGACRSCDGSGVCPHCDGSGVHDWQRERALQRQTLDKLRGMLADIKHKRDLTAPAAIRGPVDTGRWPNGETP